MQVKRVSYIDFSIGDKKHNSSYCSSFIRPVVPIPMNVVIVASDM